MLLNLLQNALKFIKQGSIAVSVDFDELTSELKVDVADTGIGIAMEEQKQLF